ncbi:MAG: hypothetical protein PHH64_06420 [Proteiniphilum sp.]|nr:hypothetical protein [Proteiniphilum sp.]MDD4159028.1 hypothetical protein [Proteiniphilum sp.]MDD4801131.1 hypothetical protein [Proteiniphilum sp.]
MMKRICVSNPLFFGIVKEEIATGRAIRIKTKGVSMRPFIVGGKDELILRQADDHSFHRGAILLAELGEQRQVAHRVCRIEGEEITLRGDGSLQLTEVCGRGDVIAEVVAVVRKGKMVEKGSSCWNRYRYLWPSSPFMRKVALKIYSLLPHRL